MASLVTNKDGRKRIEFNWNGKRNSLWLGRMAQDSADLMLNHLEHVIEQRGLGRPFRQETVSWLNELGDRWHGRLADFGLVSPRKNHKKLRRQLGDFLNAYISSRSDAKASTLVHWRQSAGSMLEFFGKDREMHTISAEDAHKYYEWMQTSAARKNQYAGKGRSDGLSDGTRNKRMLDASQFFAAAVKCSAARQNPFRGIAKAGKKDEPDRQFFVDRSMFAKVIDACPDDEWRLILTLSRYGGLRVPSELACLAWDDVDFSNKTMVIRNSTGAAAGQTRSIPIFDEIFPYLVSVKNSADPDSPKVFPGKSKTQNLRTALTRILSRAGVSPWPRLWHNMRASRVKELLSEYPASSCAQWIGGAFSAGGMNAIVSRRSASSGDSPEWYGGVMTTGLEGGMMVTPLGVGCVLEMDDGKWLVRWADAETTAPSFEQAKSLCEYYYYGSIPASQR